MQRIWQGRTFSTSGIGCLSALLGTCEVKTLVRLVFLNTQGKGDAACGVWGSCSKLTQLNLTWFLKFTAAACRISIGASKATTCEDRVPLRSAHYPKKVQTCPDGLRHQLSQFLFRSISGQSCWVLPLHLKNRQRKTRLGRCSLHGLFGILPDLLHGMTEYILRVR